MRRELVERARGGDRDAFATLAGDSIGRLFNIAQLMLRDSDQADDASDDLHGEAFGAAGVGLEF